ncbi:MAG: preprotein translocase subunit YajC [Clostridia bacterium]|nr:preprotein translocase subunit YajC [Clostridia bacterium]MBQ4587236.1 preprotein translocase subunit YajC [Clostridia bacterium]
MLINLLTESSPSGGGNTGGDWIIYVILIGFLALMIVPSIIRQRKDKKAQEEKLNAIEVGAKVTTIGLIHGEIVDVGEVYVVIKTGTEENPSFLTIEKRAIYQVHKAEEENAGESQDMPEDLPEEITDEAPVQEAPIQEAKEEAPAKEEPAKESKEEAEKEAEAE